MTWRELHLVRCTMEHDCTQTCFVTRTAVKRRRCSSFSPGPLTTPSDSSSSHSRGRKRRRWFEDPQQLQQKLYLYAPPRSESFTHSGYMARSESRTSSSARLDFNNHPVLPRPSSGPSRSPSPARKLYYALRHATPAVYFVTPGTFSYPANVVELHSCLLRDLETGFIPARFKVRYDDILVDANAKLLSPADRALRARSTGL